MRSDPSYRVPVILPSPRSALLTPLALAAAVMLASTSGCTTPPEPDPTPTPLFATDEEAFAAAEEVYREYIRAFNEVDLGDPSTFEEPADFTGGRYEAGERRDLSELHAEGYVRSGAIVILWITPERVEDDGAVYLTTCNDVGDTLLADSNGVVVTPVDRPTVFAIELRFEPLDHHLRLVDSETVEDGSCVAH